MRLFRGYNASYVIQQHCWEQYSMHLHSFTLYTSLHTISLLSQYRCYIIWFTKKKFVHYCYCVGFPVYTAHDVAKLSRAQPLVREYLVCLADILLHTSPTVSWHPIEKSTKYVYIKSTTVFVPSSESGLSHPLSRQRVCPFPRNRGGGGGEAHSPADEGLGEWSPNYDDWRKSLALCLLCVASQRKILEKPTNNNFLCFHFK